MLDRSRKDSKLTSTTEIKVYQSLEDFLMDTASTVCVYQNAIEGRFLKKFKHDKKINKYIGVDNNIELYSIIGIEVKQKDFFEETLNKKVRLFVAFTNIEPNLNYYSVIFPEQTEFSRCPRTFEVTGKMFYNIISKRFTVNNKKIDPERYLEVLYKKHLIPLRKIAGAAERVKRLLFWKLLPPTAVLGMKFLGRVYYFLTGKRYSTKYEEETFSLFEKQKVSFEVTDIVEKETEKIEILNYKISLQPLLSFSLINFILFIIFYFTDGIPDFLNQIVEKPVVTFLYSVSFFSIQYYVIGNNMKRFAIYLNKLWNKHANPKILRYVR